jgi:hypothetical protein
VFAGGDFRGKLQGGRAIGDDDRREFDGLDLDMPIVAISSFDFDLGICDHCFESLMFFGGDAACTIRREILNLESWGEGIDDDQIEYPLKISHIMGGDR